MLRMHSNFATSNIGRVAETKRINKRHSPFSNVKTTFRDALIKT